MLSVQKHLNTIYTYNNLIMFGKALNRTEENLNTVYTYNNLVETYG